MKFDNLKPIDTKQINQIEFSETQYYKEEQKKNQIVIHHTVSGSNINGVVSTWNNDEARVATPIIIGRDGVCHQLFSTKYWAHHLGVKSTDISKLGFSDYGVRNILLNKQSIGIELINWGGLTKHGNDYINAYDNKVITDISEYTSTYKGYKYFESYTDAQLNTLGSLLLYLSAKYNITLTYNDKMFEVSVDAVGGKSGIWTHTSYRNDKSDCHPDINLISMLKSLKV